MDKADSPSKGGLSQLTEMNRCGEALNSAGIPSFASTFVRFSSSKPPSGGLDRTIELAFEPQLILSHAHPSTAAFSALLYLSLAWDHELLMHTSLPARGAGDASCSYASHQSSRSQSIGFGHCKARKCLHDAAKANQRDHLSFALARHRVCWLDVPQGRPKGRGLQCRSSAASAAGGPLGEPHREAQAAGEPLELVEGDDVLQSDSANGGNGSGLRSGQPQSSPTAGEPEQKQEKQAWRLMPMVPWGTGKIVQVMVLWLLAYIIIGQVAVPVGLSLLGLDRDELGLRGHAVLHLCLDLSQLGFTLFILWHCLKQYKPRQKGFFPIKWRGLWPVVVLGACLVFPAVDWLAQQSMSWFPVDGDGWGSHMEASLSVGDWITNVAYFSVVSICAPIWEEAIFRGFLLTSLARYMSPPWAVATSSLLFAMCHFRLQTFLPLLVLGVVFSLVFLLTRNLLPPMVLHSAWNVFVLANLLLKHS